LTDRSLRRYLDSMDICQSVLGNFFVRAALGQFDITSPAQLVRLLITMARNKVIDRHRHESLARKEGNCELLEDSELARGEPSPSAIVSQKDLLHEVRNRLTAEERSLAEQRGRGETWDNIGASLGTSPEALRKRLERAFDRVAAELRLDE
jgi:RNA polymerase sigma-70 factor (ECF subfamily)